MSVLKTIASRAVWSAYFSGYRTRRSSSVIRQFAVQSPELRKSWIVSRLREQLVYFSSRDDALGEWRSLSKEVSDERLWERWQELPVLTKPVLQERFDPERLKVSYGVDGVTARTGGSTGEPTRFIWDKPSMNARRANQYDCWRAFGWTPGTPTICLWGSQRDIGLSVSPLKRLDSRLRRVRVVDGFSFSDDVVDKVWGLMEAAGEYCLYGYTGLLVELTRVLRSRGLNPPGRLIAAWNGGEGIAPGESELFQEVFGRPIQNQYGTREFGALGYQAEGMSAMRILHPYVFVEVVRADGDHCGPGEMGRLLVTTLSGRGTPFLRYEIGDLGVFGPQDRDASGVFQLSSIEGRKSGMIRVGRDKMVHNNVWAHMFKEFSSVRRYQVRQGVDGSLRILLQGTGMSEHDELRMRTLVQRAIEPLPFSVEWVDTISLTLEGKHIQVHSDLSA